MKLSEIFTQLSYGELSQMAMGNSGAGTIEDANYDRLVSSINLGLAALHTRFPIRHGEFVVDMQTDQVNYPVHLKYCASNTSSTEPVKYILDASSPYLNDLMKIERVLTQDGVVLPLNDEADEFSLSTPSLSTLRVPIDIVNRLATTPSEYLTDTLTVQYRAAHPYLVPGVGLYRAETVEIDLPYQYLEALCYFVASRVNNPLGMTNEFHSGNSYAAKYELACASLERDNIRIDQVSQPNRIERNGWV